jgi:hypothetical protein
MEIRLELEPWLRILVDWWKVFCSFESEYQDYINLRLTGRWVGSLNNMSVRWHHQTDHGGWLGVTSPVRWH